jgi:hypothetical protein
MLLAQSCADDAGESASTQLIVHMEDGIQNSRVLPGQGPNDRPQSTCEDGEPGHFLSSLAVLFSRCDQFWFTFCLSWGSILVSFSGFNFHFSDIFHVLTICHPCLLQ